jgi:glycosyltransferase involved in cell wall biosynthesis
MRLLFLEQRPRFAGGSERMSLALSGHAIRRGHTSLLVHELDGDMVAAYRRTGARSRQAPIAPVAIRRPMVAGRSIAALSWLVRRERIDWVFTSQVSYVSLLGAVNALTGVRIGVHLGLVYDYPSPLFRAGTRRVHIAGVPSEHTASGWRERGWPEASLRVIPNGVDTEVFAPGDGRAAARARLGLRAAGAPVIAYVGRLVREKGIFTLMDAFGRYRASGGTGTLLVVGTAPEQQDIELRQAAAQAGVSPESWEMRAGTPEPEDVYRAADVVVVPSEWDEPFGLVPLEAMACGTMTLVSRRGIMPSFVRAVGEAAVFPAGDAEALAARIRCWLENADRREEAAAALARDTRMTHGFEACGDAYLAAFASVGTR